MSDQTNQVIADMLRENTGAHLLDSGNYYGRHWKHNRQIVDFEDEKEVELYIDDVCGIDMTISVYHFLTKALEFSEELDQLYSWWLSEETRMWEQNSLKWPNGSAIQDRESSYHLSDMRDFVDWLRAEGFGVSGLYGEGDPFVVNTYNGACLLSQTLQYIYFELTALPMCPDSTELTCGRYCLLQIHNGCDARGGYTAPRAFKVLSEEESHLFHVARGTIICEKDYRHAWTTDDAYNWYPTGSDTGEKLNDYEVISLEDDSLIEEFREWKANQKKVIRVEDGQQALPFIENPEKRMEEVNSKIIATVGEYVAQVYKAVGCVDGTGFCPICNGKLNGYM